jgi:hypothetical protein
VVVPDSFVEDLKLWLASPENRDQKPPAQQIEQPEKSVDVDIDTTSNLPDVDLSSFETEQ